MKRPSRNTVWLIILTLWIFFGFSFFMVIDTVNQKQIDELKNNQYVIADDTMRKHNVRLVSQHDIDICDLKLETSMITEQEHANCVIRGQTSQNIYGKVGDPMNYQREIPSFQDHLQMKANERNQTIAEYLEDLME